MSKKFTFPKDFMWATATSAYQIEGGWNADGKGLSIWDEFCHRIPCPIAQNTSGDIACDSYHQYKRDVEMCQELGVSHYRLSLSWPRLLPNGTVQHVNQKGVQYYNNVLDELHSKGIQPMITLYHWDLPQALQDCGGWLNKECIKWFAEYARFCFQTFGKKCKHWITINEPFITSWYAHGQGIFAPGINGQTWAPYLSGHHQLLAHAEAYHVFDKEFRQKIGGQIGIAVNLQGKRPYDENSVKDNEATKRSIQMENGWFLHPIFSKEGDYPEEMKKVMKQNSKEEDRCTSYANMFWLTPWGLRDTLVWIKDSFDNPPVIITENGCCSYEEHDLNDKDRVLYISEHLKALHSAINEDGCSVKGYTAWSLMDNFEWASGYCLKFGLYAVDFKSQSKQRVPKASAKFYADVIKNNAIL